MAITDSWLRFTNNNLQERMITKSDRNSLSVCVTPKGKIIFQFRYRWNGKGDQIDIGTYSATSLKDAHDLVISYRGELEQYHNLKVVKRVRKESALNAVTVKGLISSIRETRVNAAMIGFAIDDAILRLKKHNPTTK
ncbi:Arm DNA-binding domain-containing protein [Xenorhabdus siamensis]|uniref:Arm DNA-binding domain-containing protein n=1 Tax=Xenorhabdus siamensis TaxID=3136254 RepID=UPI0030F4659D